jgi:hypothetical protein
MGTLKNGAAVKVDCRVYSASVRGNHDWYKISGANARWVSARYVRGSVPNYC